MIKLSQNRKIAISAIAVFIVSFSAMLAFLGNGSGSHENGQTDVLNVDEEHGASYTNSEYSVEEDFRSTLDNTTDPIFATDSEGVFEFASEDFCQLLGMDCAKILGKNFFDFVNSKDHADLFSSHSKLLLDKGELDGIGPFRVMGGNDQILLLLNARLFESDGQDLLKIIFSVKDITDQAKDINEEEKDREDWVDRLYPKIKDMNNEDTSRLMVDKISFLRW